MPRYTVVEVQEERRLRRFYYEVEAADEREAVERAMDGDAYSGPTGAGVLGDSEFGASGWSVVGADEPDIGDATNRAIVCLREPLP